MQIEERKIQVAAVLAIFLSVASHAGDVEGMSKRVKGYELGALIEILMPDENMKIIDWDWQVNSRIEWITDGVEYVVNANKTETSSRSGRVRVNVMSKVSTVLKKGSKELAWSVIYETNGPPKLGVDHIIAFPGKSSYECFGSTYGNCSFEIEPSLKKSRIDFELMCAKSEPGYKERVYRIAKSGKKPVYLIHSTNIGSGGSSSGIEMKFEFDGLCIDAVGS